MNESRTLKLRTRAAVLFAIVAVLYILFAIYMLTCEHASVYQTRNSEACRTVADYTMEIVPDAKAPAGVQKVYHWTLDTVCGDDDSISFYLVHHYAKVYLNGELVYSLQPAADNRVGKSISSNWVCVPLYPEDAGTEVTVVATPVYKSVIDGKIEFLVGSRFQIFYDCLISDMDILIVSLICILVGIFIMSMQGYMLLNRKSPSPEMFYLGIFSVILGIWRITDTRVIAFLLPKYAMALGYITIGVLVICAIPLLLFMKERMADFDGAPLLHAAMVLSVAALGILLLQVLGIADFREMLTVCHVLLAGTAIMLVVVALVRSIRNRSVGTRRSVLLISILAVGAALDILSYYLRKDSENVVFTALAFVIYVVCMFTINIFETKTKAYTDPNTGLFNKNRWDELMNQKIPGAGDVGVMMLDLNGLKRTNDTLGHDAGDRMIFNFANILRNTLPPGSMICRWGGDEFTVMLMDASRERMEQHIAQLRRATQIYNDTGNTPCIHFAAGYAMASEFPELTRGELLGKADERMYQDKRAWYQANADRR
ncbi:MAG: GGDEF domain-containing protein [Candidatus Faecousia sp.]|nr:GGDEF domain-containing protein [Candidatus Faecousia sp.]